MKTDILGRNEIELLINAFYDKVKTDDEIAFFFTESVNVNWEKHLPVMYDFWEGILFGTGKYQGNTMARHLDLNRISPMEGRHFERWMKLFISTVDENYEGINAETIKQRAMSIATVIQIKIANSKNN